MSDADKKELKHLRQLLNRAACSLTEGFRGGEWAAYVPDEVTLGAAKEQIQALNLVDEINAALRGKFKLPAGPLKGNG